MDSGRIVCNLPQVMLPYGKIMSDNTTRFCSRRIGLGSHRLEGGLVEFGGRPGVGAGYGRGILVGNQNDCMSLW